MGQPFESHYPVPKLCLALNGSYPRWTNNQGLQKKVFVIPQIAYYTDMDSVCSLSPGG